MSKAHVTSIESIADFRNALVLMIDDVQRGVAEGDSEVKRMMRWLKFEQPQVWTGRIRTLDRKLQEAQNDFRRKENALTPTGEPQSTVLERREVQKWKHLLEDAKERRQKTVQWSRRFETEALRYRGQTTGARHAPNATLPEAVADLETILNDLDAYRRVQTAAPHRDDAGSEPGLPDVTLSVEPTEKTEQETGDPNPEEES